MAMAAIAVVAGCGRRFASSWPSPCQAACREFCLRFGFVPERQADGKTRPPDGHAKRMMQITTCRPKESQEEKQKLD